MASLVVPNSKPMMPKSMFLYRSIEAVSGGQNLQDTNGVFPSETGIKITYDRDKRAADFFKKENIQWKEYLQQR